MIRLTRHEMGVMGAGNCGTRWYERELFLSACTLGGAAMAGAFSGGNLLILLMGARVARTGCSAICEMS